MGKTNADFKALEYAHERGVVLYFKNKLVSLSEALTLIHMNTNTYALVSHNKKYRNKGRIDILTDVVDKNNFSSKQYDNLKL